MDRMLFDLLKVLNGGIAVVLVLGFTWVGGRSTIFIGNPTIGLLVGLIVGVVVAASFCGLISCFALIERHLRTIAEKSAAHPQGAIQPPTFRSSRQEPTL